MVAGTTGGGGWSPGRWIALEPSPGSRRPVRIVGAISGAFAALVAAVAAPVVSLKSMKRTLTLPDEHEAIALLAVQVDDALGWLAILLIGSPAVAAAALVYVCRSVVRLESEKVATMTRLAAGLAHEVRNPLQVMLGYLSLRRDVADPRLAAQLAAVEDEARRCEQLVTSLLELSTPSHARSAADVRAICEDVAERLRASMAGAPSLVVEGRATALADPGKVRQIVFNLVKNAIQATGSGGAIEIRISSARKAVEVAVSDTGPGLPREAPSRVFEPFFTTKPEGMGLGLAVSRAIARGQGGDLEARGGERGGAVFTLRLPRASEEG